MVYVLLTFASLITGTLALQRTISTDDTGTILTLGATPYFVESTPFQTYYPPQSIFAVSGLLPITSIRSQNTPITKDVLQNQLELFESVDDVWRKDFLKNLVITYDGPAKAFFDNSAISWMREKKVANLYVSENIRSPLFDKTNVAQINKGPPSGPYFFTTPKDTSSIAFFNCYRLFRDEYEAFVFGTIPGPDGSWVATNFTLPTEKDKALYIPIPSRIPLIAKGLPLAGMRFGLKDIYDVEGLPTSAGSHAYGDLHPSSNTTASSIQKLLSLGASLVGKTHTSQFAHAANPWEFVDFPYSWNPRGDGHLTASASSSGSACAIVAYDWLDFAVGSDTRGSIRKPASMVGAYGIRPTHGCFDLDGVVPVSEEMDTAGFFVRDPKLFYLLRKLWYGQVKSTIISRRQTIRNPSKLLYPIDQLPFAVPEAQKLYDNFTQTLQEHIKIIKTPINVTHTLLPYMPDSSFSELYKASNDLAYYNSWHSVGKPTIAAHAPSHHPSFDPVPQRIFKASEALSEADYNRALAIKRKFQQDVLEHFIKSDVKSCSESLFMYDAGTGGRPSYRVEEFNGLDGTAPILLPNAPRQSFQSSSSPGGGAGGPQATDYLYFIASMAGLPEVTIPLGQVPYFSHISRRWEMLPVSVQLVAHKGCDAVLLEVVKKLGELGVAQTVKTGRLAF
ncbi:hypothetical protein AMATHDRAFT_51878 [Amanita thiersii Skay4041]|uniref:Uncharacterized protein n=1 Tax=Amanita thiersii Skay4041 TaxID=703135 RepID=A0A2A9N7L6_9AGAR|nr:hypothetical protein AMATHDRAFT_51878 [Amanita thiersii Skay4041]